MNARRPFTWEDGLDYLFITWGVVMQAVGLRLFLVPHQLATGGVAGLAQIINASTGWPIGVMVLVGNMPLFILGWKFLGGLRFGLRTVFAVILFSVVVDLSAGVLPSTGVTGDLVLNTLFGGLISGIGYGLVYRGRGTSGGSDILARILNHWRGIPISQSYLITDALIIFLAGLSFSWDKALYALVVLYISGLAAEATLEGSNVVRTAMIITVKPEEIRDSILNDMQRGVTLLPAIGGYTGAEKTLLYCVISRSEVAQIKGLVHELDPEAFMVIGQAHEAFGEGFKRIEK